MVDISTEQGFLEVYDEFSDGIFRYLLFRLYEREVAKDLTQETFMKVWEYIAKGGEIENIKAFLYRVAHNLMASYCKKKKSLSLEKLEVAGLQIPIEPKYAINVEAKRVIEMMGKLPNKYEEVLKMRYLEGFEPKEIAEIKGVSANVISVTINRGVKKLRKLLRLNK